MKLYIVYARRPLDRGERKVTVFRFIVMASGPEVALAIAKADNQHWDDLARVTWRVTQIDDDGLPIFNVGCYTDEPAPEEIEARKALPKH